MVTYMVTVYGTEPVPEIDTPVERELIFFIAAKDEEQALIKASSLNRVQYMTTVDNIVTVKM